MSAADHIDFLKRLKAQGHEFEVIYDVGAVGSADNSVRRGKTTANNVHLPCAPRPAALRQHSWTRTALEQDYSLPGSKPLPEARKPFMIANQPPARNRGATPCFSWAGAPSFVREDARTEVRCPDEGSQDFWT